MTKVNETKQKILDSANTLFASFGYDGTSVRDIAKEAGVNLAAINYHFKNKENLYCEVFNINCEKIETGLRNVVNDNMSTSDFAVQVYKHFIENGNSLLNTFKIMLTGNVKIPDCHLHEDPECFGPPGGDILLAIITKEVGEDIPLDGRFWAMNMIFSHVTHMAIIMNTSIIKEKVQGMKHMTEAFKERNISFHCTAVLDFLRNSPLNQWDSTAFPE
ncbi:hypothetical protein A9Q84_03860 [Halobacteriovorax marinus]|uniref:HTH tetR-type domain-containing protein n=1 Tax=Halobacteriovorax marinus TaxID=97084 RepID=A0A1Y5FAM9_9BACT|nr:hypothetical protein A9Q84_03860 [Halobacteriovorax marinus]